MNIIETVQKNLGFSALVKIDPNTQETQGNDIIIGNDAIAQAGIPAVLLGIYNKLESDPDLSTLVPGQPGSCLEKLFGQSTDLIVKRIYDYSRIQDIHSIQQLEHIASESMRVVRENISPSASEKDIRNFVAKHKAETLLYLPPVLRIGIILKNNNLDDRTGKMEGPVSSFMHHVEKTFNTSGSDVKG
jgi:hypothetical protein